MANTDDTLLLDYMNAVFEGMWSTADYLRPLLPDVPEAEGPRDCRLTFATSGEIVCKNR